MTTTSGELLTYAQAAARLNLGVLDIRRLVRTEQCPVVTDSRGRRRIPAQWIDDPQGWLAEPPTIELDADALARDMVADGAEIAAGHAAGTALRTVFDCDRDHQQWRYTEAT